MSSIRGCVPIRVYIFDFSPQTERIIWTETPKQGLNFPVMLLQNRVTLFIFLYNMILTGGVDASGHRRLQTLLRFSLFFAAF